MNLFMGAFEHTVDAKNRVSVPRKILEVLRSLDASSGVVITTGLDGCLFLYPPQEFERMSATVEAGPVGALNVREFARTFFSHAEACSIDKHGRMLLPEALKCSAGIEDKVLFAGVGKRVELWRPDTWRQRDERAAGSYEAQAQDVFR